jgi:bacterioferritin-associated ferredoxin
MQLTRILIWRYPVPAMYVCVCHGITDRQIRAALDEGATTLGELQRHLPVGSSCGRCLDAAHELIGEHGEELAGCVSPCPA